MESRTRSASATRTIAAAAAALLCATALSGCMLLEPIRADPAPTPTETETERPYLPTPDGFTRAGDVAYQWVEQGVAACVSPSGCYHVDVYAFEDCASGVYFEAELRDGDNQYHDALVGSSVGTLPSLAAGETGRIELPATVPGAWAFLYEAYCE